MLILILIIFWIFAGVGQTPAKIQTPIAPKWEVGSIYEISFSDNRPRMKGKDALLYEPLQEAIEKILKDDNTSYGDFLIEYKYIPDEDLYIIDLIDEFVEL